MLGLRRNGRARLASAVVPPYGRVWSPAGQSGGLARLSAEVEEYFDIGLVLRSGDVVVDVGANVGLFALAAMRRVPDVRYYAFEPVPELYRALEENVYRGAIEHTGTAKLFPMALGEDESREEVELFYFRNFPSDSTQHIDEKRGQFEKFFGSIVGNGRSGRVLRPIVLRTLRSRLGHWISDRVTGLERVASKATTLSRVMGTDGLDRIDALKIDVEGAELDVLEGISDTHWGCVRQVALEGHDQDGRLDRVKALLSRHGFDRIEVRVSDEHRQRELNNYLLLAQRRADAGARPTSGAPGT